jgi:uncharacterized protein YjbI with pentapeptide repeats
MSLLDLLAAGDVEAFNAQRGQRSAPDLFAADLADLKLAGVDFSGANLEKCDLSGTDLTGAILFKANLSGADLTGANLKDVVAIKSRWREAYLGEATLDAGDFTGADFSDAELPEVSARGANFSGARLRRVQAAGAVLDGADLTEAKLAEADLKGAHLSGATLVEAKLGGAAMAGAHLDGADLSRARAGGADLTAADLSGAKLPSADLTGARLIRANLAGADLTRADLGGADLTDAALTGADFTDARVEGLDAEALSARGAVVGGAGGSGLSDQPTDFHFEDVSAAVCGGALGALWENDEDGQVMAIRVAVARPDEVFSGVAPALSAPADLTLARSLVAAERGFMAAVLVERPGGVSMELTEIGLDGAVGATRALRMEYRPAVRPVIIERDGGFIVYGLGRDGPTLFIHRYDGGEALERVFGARVSNARGFVGGRQPVMVTKGGVLQALTPAGLGAPLALPESFPGRAGAACQVGDEVWLAWTPRGENGFRWARLGEGGEEGRVSPKSGVTALDLAATGRGVLAVYAREEGGMGQAGIWGCWLGQGPEFPVLVDEVIDVEELVVVRTEGDHVHLVCTTITEDLFLLEVAGEQTFIRCQLP